MFGFHVDQDNVDDHDILMMTTIWLGGEKQQAGFTNSTYVMKLMLQSRTRMLHQMHVLQMIILGTKS